MLPDTYAQALQALKDVARATSAQIVGGDETRRRAELMEARSRKAKFGPEVRIISQLLMRSPDPSLTIYTLDESRLERELESVNKSAAGFSRIAGAAMQSAQ